MSIEKRGEKYCVLSDDGEQLGSHDTEDEAKAQLASLESSKRSDSGEIVERVDVGRLNVEELPQGGLRIQAYVGRSGILVYKREDGTERREYRPPDEAFSAKALKTLRGAAVTDLHPPEMVEPSNHRKYAVGHVGDDVRRDGDFIAASLYIQDADALARVKGGERREISAGYKARVVPASGQLANGERFDFIQRDVEFNHAAIGPRGWGRAGSKVELRLDSNGSGRLDCGGTNGGKRMKTVRIDGKDVEVSDEVAATLEKVVADREAMRVRQDAQDKALEEIKARADKAEAPERIAEAVKARAEVETLGRRLLGQDVKLDGKTDREILEAAFRTRDKERRLDGLSDAELRAYLRGCVDALPRQDAERVVGGAAFEKLRNLRPASGGTQEAGGRAALASYVQRPGERFDDAAASRALGLASEELWKQPIAGGR